MDRNQLQSMMTSVKLALLEAQVNIQQREYKSAIVSIDQGIAMLQELNNKLLPANESRQSKGLTLVCDTNIPGQKQPYEVYFKELFRKGRKGKKPKGST